MNNNTKCRNCNAEIGEPPTEYDGVCHDCYKKRNPTSQSPDAKLVELRSQVSIFADELQRAATDDNRHAIQGRMFLWFDEIVATSRECWLTEQSDVTGVVPPLGSLLQGELKKQNPAAEYFDADRPAADKPSDKCVTCKDPIESGKGHYGNMGWGPCCDRCWNNGIAASLK